MVYVPFHPDVPHPTISVRKYPTNNVLKEIRQPIPTLFQFHCSVFLNFIFRIDVQEITPESIYNVPFSRVLI